MLIRNSLISSYAERMEGWKDESVEGWKGWFCLNRGLRGLHAEDRLLSARFSFNAGTSNQEINGMNDI